MPIHTVTSQKRARTRADQHRNNAARIIAKMRDGVTLRQHFTSSGPAWFLSDGTKVHPDTAKIVITNTSICGVGDCLFPRATAVSQIFRWSD